MYVTWEYGLEVDVQVTSPGRCEKLGSHEETRTDRQAGRQAGREEIVKTCMIHDIDPGCQRAKGKGAWVLGFPSLHGQPA